MSKKQITRRDLLKNSGLSLVGTALMRSPTISLLDAITRGSISKAIAAEQGLTPRKWIDMRFDFAPPRWTYDLFLQANDADNANFVSGDNKQVITRYVEQNSRYVSGIYSTTKIGTVRAPYLWQFDIPKVGGTMRPMKDLLNNFLNIRGIYTGNSGHDGNIALHYSPIGAAKSISALSADASNAAINAIYYNAFAYGFKSTAGKSTQEIIANGNLLNNLLTAYRPSTAVAKTRANEALVKNYLDATRTALGAQAVQRHPDAAVAEGAMKGARDLIFKSFGDLNVKFPALVAKYQDLITRSLHLTLPGINDKPIGVAGTRDLTYQLGNGVILKTNDLRTLITSSATLFRTAEAFALAEFTLMNDLSDSITVGIGPMRGLQDDGTNVGYGFDEHFIGALPSLLINSLQSCAHAACMLELIDQLKAKGIWADTVINCSGEMNRTPAKDGHGADHSATANMALYSGCIQGPLILGNISAQSANPVYPGTWGAAAKVTELGGYVEPTHAINTVATLLRVPPVVPARTSLLTTSGNGVAPNVPTGKIVV